MPHKASQIVYAFLGLILVLALLLAWNTRGQQFSKAPSDVRSALLSATIQTGWLGENSRLVAAQTSPDVVTTRFVNHSGETSLIITSEIASSISGSRVDSTFSLNRDALSTADKAALDKADDGLTERYVDEHIASHVQGRTFDITALSRGFGMLKFIARFASEENNRASRSLEPSFAPISPELAPSDYAAQSEDGFTSDLEIERAQHSTGHSFTHDGGGNDWGIDYD